MVERKRIEYTQAAQDRLQSALVDYQKKLEDIIADEQFIPGEAAIEVTASDVEQATRRLMLQPRTSIELRSLIIRVYFVIGVLTALAGVFYPWLHALFQNRKQLLLFATGLGMILASMLLAYWNRVRQSKAELEKLQVEKVWRASRFYDTLKKM